MLTVGWRETNGPRLQNEEKQQAMAALWQALAVCTRAGQQQMRRPIFIFIRRISVEQLQAAGGMQIGSCISCIKTFNTAATDSRDRRANERWGHADGPTAGREWTVRLSWLPLDPSIRGML
jgi:hypothetical protein